MPELPEVETIRAGLEPLIVSQSINQMKIYDDRLRWPVDKGMCKAIQNTQILAVGRRSKYLLIETLGQKISTLIIHLGMSGRLYLVTPQVPKEKHTHLEWYLNNGLVLRYTDPRRFGSVFFDEFPDKHRLLSKLGPEPLSADFTGQYLHRVLQSRKQAIKVAIMNAHLVVGVGNIYASESLFRVKIHPQTPANRLSLKQCKALVESIQKTLHKAIDAGGTTLKDFVNSSGQPGYFQQSLGVYGRTGKPCIQCQRPIEMIQLAQRSTYFCPQCQPLISAR